MGCAASQPASGEGPLDADSVGQLKQRRSTVGKPKKGSWRGDSAERFTSGTRFPAQSEDGSPALKPKGSSDWRPSISSNKESVDALREALYAAKDAEYKARDEAYAAKEALFAATAVTKGTGGKEAATKGDKDGRMLSDSANSAAAQDPSSAPANTVRQRSQQLPDAAEPDAARKESSDSGGGHARVAPSENASSSDRNSSEARDTYCNEDCGAGADNGRVVGRLSTTTRFSFVDERSGSVEINRRQSHQYMRKLDGILSGWDIMDDEIEICKHEDDGSDWVLGWGSFGRVYRGTRGGVQDVAVKVLFNADEQALRTFVQEISLLKSLNYDRNIVQFYGAQLQEGKVPMLVTEFMEGGDLLTAINNDFQGHLKWNARGFSLALDIARGIHFLHRNGVIHSDIKSSNILLDRSLSTAKIADVGLARVMERKQYRTSDEHSCSFCYAAPEILLGKVVDEKSDIYSLGVVLWELVARERPVRGRLSKPSTEDCPEDIAALISACMKTDPALRPTARQVFDRIKAAHNSVVKTSSFWS